MSIKIIDGDLFDTNAKFICHQVNCQGRMGSGVAKQIRAKYPKAYSLYMHRCAHNRKEMLPTHMLLGVAQFVPNDDGITIVNMYSQDKYGYDGHLYTDYDSFRKCLHQIRNVVPPGEPIAMPYKIGCGLGGGDWNTILQIIEDELHNHTIVELWRKEG